MSVLFLNLVDWLKYVFLKNDKGQAKVSYHSLGDNH